MDIDDPEHLVEEASVSYNAVRRFEDLAAWQRARELNRLIYRVTRDTRLRQDRDLVSQMRRASVSVMSNIAEGHERSTPREFHRFLLIAKASCAEVRSQLYAALDAGYIDEPVFQRCFAEADRTGQVIGGLRAAVARRMNAG